MESVQPQSNPIDQGHKHTYRHWETIFKTPDRDKILETTSLSFYLSRRHIPLYSFDFDPDFNVTAALLKAGLPVSLTLAAAPYQH